MIRRGTPQVNPFIESSTRLFRDHAPDGRCISPYRRKPTIEPRELIRSGFVVPVQIGDIEPSFLAQMRLYCTEIF